MVNPEASPSPPREVGEAEPILILIPTGRDAAVAVACLHAAGIRTHLCANVEEVCTAMDTAAGLLADEALPALAT